MSLTPKPKEGLPLISTFQFPIGVEPILVCNSRFTIKLRKHIGMGNQGVEPCTIPTLLVSKKCPLIAHVINGASGGIRTHNVSNVQDFKSCVSRQLHHTRILVGYCTLYFSIETDKHYTH